MRRCAPGERSQMSRKLRIVFFAHSFRSDWNNGNAHLLRGLARELGRLGHAVTCYEHSENWSHANLIEVEGELGVASVEAFARCYADLRVELLHGGDEELRSVLRNTDVALVHEWNAPEFMARLLDARQGLG